MNIISQNFKIMLKNKLKTLISTNLCNSVDFIVDNFSLNSNDNYNYFNFTNLSNNSIRTIILACIGDINRFEHSCQLLAYAGLDPSVIQSGNFQARSTRMSKRGSGMLRYSLVYSAHNVAKNNKTFKEYYELKRSQGKSHYCALGHVAHKLVRVIFKMLKDNIAFDLA